MIGTLRLFDSLSTATSSGCGAPRALGSAPSLCSRALGADTVRKGRNRCKLRNLVKVSHERAR